MGGGGGSGEECASCNSAARGQDLCGAVLCFASLGTPPSLPGYESSQGL